MTHERPEDNFTHVAGRVAHVHFTDSDAGGSHLAWGDGIIDLDKLVTYLRGQSYEDSLTIGLTNWKYNVGPTPPLKQFVEALRKALCPA
ncbi:MULTISPECIES: hypothetical protein [Mesorhizobium]|uniref:hypothetical protein n=1 Tax=Mesorhizobium TaxID=68287 RepID=UPI001F391701|nr:MULTISPECIES: hypothetical protein [Mesorhizobium]MCF6124276.1 hypothetical protein [Mesorhizobium ciceri]MCQ8816763.1 hypothetical protein [Mesorhizobium sp. SEMIA396]